MRPLVIAASTMDRNSKLTAGREFEMIRLKEEVNSLLGRLGEPKRYDTPDMKPVS